MSNVHKFMTSLPSDGGCHMDVCVRVGGLLLFRFAVAPSAAAARVVCLHCQPEERGQRGGSCHPIEAMGRCLSSLLSFKQVGLREPPEQYQS